MKLLPPMQPLHAVFSVYLPPAQIGIHMLWQNHLRRNVEKIGGVDAIFRASIIAGRTYCKTTLKRWGVKRRNEQQLHFQLIQLAFVLMILLE